MNAKKYDGNFKEKIMLDLKHFEFNMDDKDLGIASILFGILFFIIGLIILSSSNSDTKTLEETKAINSGRIFSVFFTLFGIILIFFGIFNIFEI